MTPDRLTLIAAVRALMLGILAYLGNAFLDSGSPHWVAALGAVVGALGAYKLTRSRVTFLSFLLVLAALFVLNSGAFLLIDNVFSEAFSEVFVPYQLQQHIVTALLFLTVSSLLTWFYFRIEGFSTAELIGSLALLVALLSGHRNFHFEYPRVFNSIAWDFGVSPLAIFIVLGISTTTVALLYAYLTARFELATSTRATPASAIKRNLGARLLVIASVGGLFYLIGSYLYGSFNAIQLVRTTNGVGLERSPGLSPLGFHSALGSTNQPAALVRLDGDYRNNPFTPMLYLRENALSDFNGREMVMAQRVYDRDVTATTPDEAFVGDPDSDLVSRAELSLSAYLLTNHNTAFAIDYPISITPIRNPNPERFKGSFKSVSLVPQYALDEVINSRVGDPRWNDATWKHYLQLHTDPRYGQLAMQLAAGAQTPVEKAAKIVNYLNENAIYTLTPNYDVAPNADPVAPFLFGEMRGYCVHFAHASVYMLRALGIPARIGTGYLTDLSQSKDGHILLRMSDRHAWAEVYIENRGWVPFDTKPQRVESHAETQVDMKLLEELMGMLGQDELLFPKDLAKDEPGLTPPPRDFSLRPPNVLPALLGAFILLMIAKLWVRWSWLIPARPHSKLRRAYRASASYFYDVGLVRDMGETKREYQSRISQGFGAPFLSLTPHVLVAQYANSEGSTLSTETVRQAMKAEARARKQHLPLPTRLLASWSPLSIISLLRRQW